MKKVYHIGKLNYKVQSSIKKNTINIFLILFITVSFLWLTKALFIGYYPDFTIYYEGTGLFLESQNPYKLTEQLFAAYPYPPIVLFLFIPFTYLQPMTAGYVWTALSISSLLISLVILSNIFSIKFFSRWGMLLAGLTFISFPVKFTLGMGQINMLILLLLVLSLYFLKLKKEFTSGIFLGLSIVIKLFPVFLPIYFFFYTRSEMKVKKVSEFKRRGFYFFSFAHHFIWVRPKQILQNLEVLSGIIFVVSVSVILIVLFVPFDIFDEFLFNIFPSLVFSSKLEYYNQALSGFIGRSFGTDTFANSVKFTLSFVISTIAFYAVTKNKNPDFLTVAMKFGLFITISLLINTFSWQHHFVWLIIPFYATFFYLQKFHYPKIYYVLLAVSYFLVSVNFKDPSVLPVLLQSHVFFGAAILLIISVQLLFLKQQK